MKNETNLTIKEIKQKLSTITSIDDPLIDLCERDERVGVKHLLEQWKKKRKRDFIEEERLKNMLVFERQARVEGFRLIAGVDEVGRGPLAGPVVAAAVILPDEFVAAGIDDSKRLSPKKREQLYELIIQKALSVGIGIVEADEIDRINIYEATKKAMNLAIRELTPFPDYLLIDAMTIDVPVSQKNIVKGDGKSLSIASASIVAKVSRDRMMVEYGEKYPGYGFEKNMGYGTKEHLEGIKRFGPCPIHRKTFAPIKDLFL
ncbi:ribonuclease HII [Fervidibacillus albus]|uniref:Ribonuclease HII n=1 Tax=Fervidibacillus albus TaxID=2980026 RepID=A0A9E8RYJ3_9BACI|nr:ribonuclease HII [Fervidibacillus albus]WAA10697.1 ribonuclease HII [Fervidibacillus albus]